MSLFQVGLGRSRPPDPPALTSYVDRVLALSPHLYLPDGRNKHASVAGPTGTAVNSPQTGVTSLAQDDAGGSSTGFSGVTTSTPHVTVPSPLSGASITLHMLFQADNVATKAKHVLATHSGGAAVGQISVEVLQNGAVRAFSDDAANTAFSFQSTTGVIEQGRAVSIVYQRQSNVAGWSQRLYVNGVRVAEDTTQRTWPIFATGTFYIGTWWNGADFFDPADGLIAHVAGWNSLLTPVQIVDLARAQSVAWAESFDAGSVQSGSVLVVNIDQQAGTHGRQPITVSAGNGSLVTTNELFNSIEITAGGTPGTNDTFTYSFTDGDGRVSPTRTVTVDVTAAAAGLSIGALTAFQPSRVQVTALGGWPAGRTPKDVVTQGTHAHGYVRRAWKPTDFNGTYMDFQAGWRKTSAAGTIRLRLDNNSEIDLSYTVDHSIPDVPAPAARRARSANSAAANFRPGARQSRRSPTTTCWSCVLEALADEVYPIDQHTGGPISTASGVKVVAHPDDLAAGRRPRIHVWGGRFAKYADELNAGHWVLHADLGLPHGKIWKTVSTFSSALNVGAAYRTKSGGLRRLYSYTNTASTPGGYARLADKLYPRIHAQDPDTPSEFDLYQGPGLYWHPSKQTVNSTILARATARSTSGSRRSETASARSRSIQTCHSGASQHLSAPIRRGTGPTTIRRTRILTSARSTSAAALIRTAAWARRAPGSTMPAYQR